MKRLRRVFRKQIVPAAQTLAHHLKFIDESGVNLGLTRLFGRATPGQRVVEATPGTSGPHYTVVAAVGLDGVQAPWLLEGAMNTVSFETYVEQILVPTLRVGDWVVLDNLSVHKGSPVRSAIEARGAQIIFLPPYSPDLNPIELCWAKVKTALRAAKARTWDTLVDALASALRAVSPADIQAWFTHCGYASP
ncbi:MAG TPA: IS630 family transposase [Bradyrhizobium sp.]